MAFLGTGSAYVFDGFIAAFCCLAEPDNDTTRFGVDIGHEINLLPLLVWVILIDTDCIYPEDSLENWISNMQ